LSIKKAGYPAKMQSAGATLLKNHLSTTEIGTILARDIPLEINLLTTLFRADTFQLFAITTRNSSGSFKLFFNVI
jgi:hypothetical protein